MRARDGETTEVLDIRVEIESQHDDVGDRVPGRPEMEGLDVVGEGSTPEPTPDLHIPDDPTVLSYLLSGIVQVELPRRQALLEAETTVERLEGLVGLLERELVLLTKRLRYFSPDPASLGGPRRS
jgi:hypothetical protein